MRYRLEGVVKNLLLVLIFAGIGVANAGSYEDFFSAIQRDDPAKVRELLGRGFDANTIDPKGRSGLYLALSEPSPKAVQVLVDWSKTDVNRLNASGESALMIAALKGNLELATKLIEKGAELASIVPPAGNVQCSST